MRIWLSVSTMPQASGTAGTAARAVVLGDAGAGPGGVHGGRSPSERLYSMPPKCLGPLMRAPRAWPCRSACAAENVMTG